MADIKPSRPTVPGHSPAQVQVYKWVLPAGGTDAGLPVTIPISSDRSVDVYGSFAGGGTVVWEGGNDPDAPDYKTLNDSRGEGNPLSWTSADIRQVLEVATKMRPRKTAGSGEITVVLTAVSKG